MNFAIAENDQSMEVNEYDLMLVHGGSGGGGGGGASGDGGAHGAGGTGEPQPNVDLNLTGNDISVVGTLVSFVDGRAGAVIAAVGQVITYVTGY